MRSAWQLVNLDRPPRLVYSALPFMRRNRSFGEIWASLRAPHVALTPGQLALGPADYGRMQWLNRPGYELTPRSWTNFKGSHGEVRTKVQAQGC